MKQVILSLVLSFVGMLSFSQGTLRGKITDENGEPLIGATISMKFNPSVGSVADFDGDYSLKVNETSLQVFVISYIGYKTSEETIQLKNNEVVIRNFVMVSSAKEVKDVQIVAKAVRARDYYMEKVKMNSAKTIDYVSAESMRKTGDANVTAAVTRVAGVSTNGAFITVRGIGDRYVKTTINGMRIPTLDPFTNNIKLDLFPSSLIDNVIITKTASPDIPGDWAGAYLSIETKDYPEALTVNVETSFGYNSQTTSKEVIASQRSSTDWLGFDNKFRDHNHDVFYAADKSLSQYQVLSSVGLSDYYHSMGVYGWDDGTSVGETYFKLGLVQLGLLAPALFDNPSAVTKAKSQYLNGPYAANAFNVINGKVPETGKSFPNNWTTTKRNAPLNFSQSLSVGNQFNLFGKPLGFIGGFRYATTIVNDPNAIANRENISGDGTTANNLSLHVTKSERGQVSKETNAWSALLNLSYKLNSNNSVSLLFMPNFAGVNNVLKGDDYLDPEKRYITNSQFYEQRKQLVYQLKSEHFFPGRKLKMELNASYTRGKSSAPDFKNLQYRQDTIVPNTDYPQGGYFYLIGNGIGEEIHRYYRYLSENLFDSQLSIEVPLKQQTELSRKLKLGGFYQRTDKKTDQYDYQVFTSTTQLLNGNVESFLDLNNFNIQSYTDVNGNQQNTLDLFYVNNGTAADHNFGNSTVAGGFALLDYALTPRLRFAGGIRVEYAKIFTDVSAYNSLRLARNDPRRSPKPGELVINPGSLEKVSYLPSANIIYKLRNDDLAPVNLRLNFSQTVARPSIRELSDVAFFDYELRSPVFGNSDLKMVRINNYDFRLESIFKSGESISASLFYKTFKDHIELVNIGGYSWQNVDKSVVAGLELEGRKKILRNLEFGANLTIADSRTEFVRSQIQISGGIKEFILQDTVKRTMYGQAPYAINAILNYTSDSLGLTIALSYNIQGPRLVIASFNKLVPDIYELPRNLVDIKISKKLGKHFSASFTVRDIFNAPLIRSYGKEKGSKLSYDKFTWGTNYLFGISYKI